uniref:Uncharacterized protein n=1 Tax=Zea mays TaxID=4577 RepID=C0PD36_MAIZE|nr:unknown [Zea mays]
MHAYTPSSASATGRRRSGGLRRRAASLPP